uniref:receptor protein-tyrosine kinase n=1 Tax=Setaria digitata TaxID=48799 RepID=A0A915PX02_9BILA
MWSIWIFSLLAIPLSAHDDVYCRSLDIRNSPNMAFQDKETNEKWSTLANCTVMEGDFSVSMITSSNFTHENFPVFSRLRVITGHLLIFQVSALRSLKRIFPNLRIIGGQELIMNYALVIYQNTHLVEIGLPKLTTIINGGVRIMDNTQLCYSRYIDWSQILIGPANDILTDQNKGTESDLCNDDCVPQNEHRCHRRDHMLSCWDAETCQLECKYTWNDDKTVGPGCDDDGEKCHDQCLGGCSATDDPSACHFCKNVIYQGICMEKCPVGLYEIHHIYLVRRCVTMEECQNISAPVTMESTKKRMLIVGNMCRVDCPFGQEIDPTTSSHCIKCEGYCPVKCKGGTIDSFARINDYLFKKCNVIEGYLEIELRKGLDAAGMEKISEALGYIEVIEGYLLIDFSISFISLHMFKRLRLIKGSVLYRDRYALAIFENANLRQIFDIGKQPLTLGNGTVLFQNNRMLCYNRIKALIDHIGLKDVKENDVSYYSNGDRAVCDETTFEVQTEDVHSFGFMISWVAFNTTDMDHRKFLGYQVFYKKVDGPDPTLSIDDDRSACSDSWQMHFEPEKGNGNEGLNRGAGIFAVESNTWYAYYVQTKLINHPGARNAISKIHFLKTLFSTPDPPKDVVGKSLILRPDQIDLAWEPPERPNGDITHYVVKWQVLGDDPSTVSGNVCDDKTSAGLRHHKDINDRIIHASPEQQFCSKAGCCDCRLLKQQQQTQQEPKGNDIFLEDERANEADFENAVQNLVFVQQDSKKSLNEKSRIRRSRRSIVKDYNEPNEKQYGDERLIFVTQNEMNETTSLYRSELDIGTHKINVTTRRLSIVGLRHFTQYQIWIHACQNISAPGGAYCSQRPGWMVVRTAPIAANDLVDNRTIKVINSTSFKQDPRSRKITWQEPSNPNGIILAYRVTVVAENLAQTPISQCVKASNFREREGVVFNGLAEGEYLVQVETISMASLSFHAVKEIAVAHKLFKIVKPAFFTTTVISLIAVIVLLVLSIGSLAAYYISRKILGEKVREYVRQQISANPEYLSQMDVYKPDEWELKRNTIHLEEEIGRGTFGKVYRGYGDNCRSYLGVTFGECAIKTVSETANSAERLHFLIEASVMKQFNTSFIVKLYGVVSDGQPVLVVMEMMKKGNLRDYLRSRRPNAEENIHGLPVPGAAEFVRWASQVADGMAYLESLKFCHRDLAARNCMVNEFDTVKIGDFGMARDIYYHEYYKPAGKRLMPVRWMAPESLMDGKFTMKSDVWIQFESVNDKKSEKYEGNAAAICPWVWSFMCFMLTSLLGESSLEMERTGPKSYGITIYEMLTLAQQPYLGLGNESVFDYIGVKKKILARPTGCPDFWYELMKRCWKYDPRDRPTFAQIVAILLRHAEDVMLNFPDDEFREMSFVVSNQMNMDDDDLEEEMFPVSDTTRLMRSTSVGHVGQNETSFINRSNKQGLNHSSSSGNIRYLSNNNEGADNQTKPLCFSNRRDGVLLWRRNAGGSDNLESSRCKSETGISLTRFDRNEDEI